MASRSRKTASAVPSIFKWAFPGSSHHVLSLVIVCLCIPGFAPAQTTHSGTLYDASKNYSNAPTPDCGGNFYDADGRQISVPPLPVLNTDKDVKRWEDSVKDFYLKAYTAPSHKVHLSLGKADLCAAWAILSKQCTP